MCHFGFLVEGAHVAGHKYQYPKFCDGLAGRPKPDARSCPAHSGWILDPTNVRMNQRPK